MITYEEFCEFIEMPYIISFDNNVLMDLYRNPTQNAKDLLSLFEKIKSKTNITYQVYKEYLNNYKKVRGEEKKKYDKVKNELKSVIENTQRDIEKKIKGYKRYNYKDIGDLQEFLTQKIDEMKNKADSYLSENANEIEENMKFLENDEVKSYIDSLNSIGNILQEISFEKRIEILREGEIRYNNLLPPGYEDIDKEGMDKYGDLFVWKELMSIPEKKKVNIIFTTNDTKEDWWIKDKRDNCVCIRPELEKEFLEKNPEYKIEMLTLDVFYCYMSKHLNIQSLHTTLNLGIHSFINSFMSKRLYYNKVEANLIETVNDIDLTEYALEEFNDSELVWDEWSIDNGSVEIRDEYAIYNFETNGHADFKLYYEDNEGDNIDIGEINIDLVGNVVVKCKINENYQCDDEPEIINIDFHVDFGEFRSMEIIYMERESDAKAEMMDALENYYSH